MYCPECGRSNPPLKMCQGVIILLIKFKGKKLVLSGVGSPSDLIADNEARLRRLGWTNDGVRVDIIGVESDFSGWNRYKIIWGIPTKKDVVLLRKEYKRIAGSAAALLRYIRLIGRVDGGLVALLNAPARKIYEEICAPARKIYEEACASAWVDVFKRETNRVGHLLTWQR